MRTIQSLFAGPCPGVNGPGLISTREDDRAESMIRGRAKGLVLHPFYDDRDQMPVHVEGDPSLPLARHQEETPVLSSVLSVQDAAVEVEGVEAAREIADREDPGEAFMPVDHDP
jgi:hypothetical protein